jgi:hypothetical protein
MRSPETGQPGLARAVRERLLLVAVIAGVTLPAVSCSSAAAPSSVASVMITPAATAITPVGSYTAQLEAVVTLADGAIQNVSGKAMWQSSNTMVAVVSATGFVAAGGFGVADITATYDGATAAVRVTFMPDLITVGLP